RLAPSDTVVSLGRMLKRTAWLLDQLCGGAEPGSAGFASVRDSASPFCRVSERLSPSGTERLKVVPTLPSSRDGSSRVSIEALSQASGKQVIGPEFCGRNGWLAVVHASLGLQIVARVGRKRPRRLVLAHAAHLLGCRGRQVERLAFGQDDFALGLHGRVVGHFRK